MQDSLILLVVLPLLLAFLLPVIARYLGNLSGLTGSLLLLFNILLLANAWNSVGYSPKVILLGGFAAPLGIVFYIDKLNMLFAILTTIIALLLWPCRTHNTDVREYVLWLLLLAGCYGVILSGDLFNIYVFYELLAVASYGLVTLPATGASYIAGFRYLMISALGSAFALLGIALIYSFTGSVNIAHLAQIIPDHLHHIWGYSAALLLIIGFGVKAELFPVNFWVAEVYSHADKRVTALLAGVVSKIAVLIILRFIILLFPWQDIFNFLLLLGIIGVIVGEFAAFYAQDLLRLLAFSSIAQSGLVIIAFACATEAGIMAGIALAIHHLLLKPALFLLASHCDRSINDLAGLAKSSPWASALFVILALSLLGVPPLPGFWAKLLLLQSLMAEQYLLLLVLVLLATIVEAAYLFRLFMLFYQRQEMPEQKRITIQGQELYPVITLSGILLLGLFFLPLFMDSLREIAMQTSNIEAYINTVLGKVQHIGEGNI